MTTSDQQKINRATFMRAFVHDIKAPIRHINMSTTFISEDMVDGTYDNIDEHLRTISRSSDRMQDIVSGLEAYFAPEPDISPEAVSLDTVVDGAIADLSRDITTANADVVSNTLPHVVGFQKELERLFDCLIKNAIQYSASSHPRVRISASSDNGICTISVQDDGLGILEKHFELIFEPFKRLWSKDEREGAGLGLTICRKIAQEHGGEIWCESEIGVGSTFFVSLEEAGELAI